MFGLVLINHTQPPISCTCLRDQRYLPTISHDEFCESLAKLNARKIMYAVSYDGRTGEKVYGEPMPESLQLRHLELRAGRSTQATLLGRDEVTYEGFYLSPALAEIIDTKPSTAQLVLW